MSLTVQNAYQVIILLSVTSEILCCYFWSYDPTCSDLDPFLVSREDWGASEPTGPLECLVQPAKYVIIHHTVTDPCTDDQTCADAVKMIQKENQEDKKWPDIGYHFVICGNGKAYVGRPGYKVGGHTKYHNRVSIGIAFLGDFTNTAPSTDMLDLVPKITYCGVKQGYIDPNFLVIAHKDAYCSPCPGDALYAIVKSWSMYPDTVPIPSYTCDATTTAAPQPETTTATPTTTEAVTTAEPTTQAATTTEQATTTTAVPTTTTTAAPTTTTAQPLSSSGWPIFYYVVMSKKPIPTDVLTKLMS